MKPKQLIASSLCLVLCLTSATFAQDTKAEADKLRDEALTLFQRQTADTTRQAIEKAESAVQLYRQARLKAGEAFSLVLIGLAHARLGNRPQALIQYEQALPLWREVQDPAWVATTLNNLGVTYVELSENQKALDYFEQALVIRRDGGDKAAQATILSNIGAIYNNIGDQQKALGYYGQALSLARVGNDKNGEAITLNNIGKTYRDLGQYQQALSYFKQALPLSQKPETLARTWGNIGTVYDDLGEKQEALNYHERVLSLLHEIGDKQGEATTLNNIGKIYDDLNQWPKALEYYLQALPLRREIKDKSGEATTQDNIGAVYVALGAQQKALEFFGQALTLHRQVSDRGGEAKVLNNIGKAYSLLGENRKAANFYLQALPLLRAVGNKNGEASILDNLMGLGSALGGEHFAVALGKQSINTLQRLRADIRTLNKEAQQSFQRSKEHSYSLLADILLTEGRLSEAHQVLTFAKDQEFFDLPNEPTTSQNALARSLSMTPREAEVERRMQSALERITPLVRQLAQLRVTLNVRQPSPAESAELKRLNDELENETAAFQKLFWQLAEEINSSPTAENRLATVDDATKLQQTLRELHQRTGTKAFAVYTLMGSARCHTLLVTPDKIATAEAKITLPDFEQKALKLLRVLQNPRYDPRPLAKEFYKLLFKPIEPEVKKAGATLLMWSLDRSLRYLPMAALYDGQQYLAERYQHVVFTRASKERLLAEVSGRWTGLGFGAAKAHEGFQPLPGVPWELNLIFGSKRPRVTGVLSGPVLLDEKFTRQAFLAALKQQVRKSVVHIASHFRFRPGEDSASFLLLGNGEKLSLAELKQEAELFRGVELLTLSACSTAAQQANAFGREVDGFAELAQRLGAGAVLASLWEVSDASTPVMMAEFYRQRQRKAGTTKAAAQRQAQLALLRGEGSNAALAEQGKRAAERVWPVEKDVPAYKVDPKKPHAHPYYWSPFILVGNWR
jgi:CHAT domain-containing protein